MIMDASNFRGTTVALVTPFDSEGQIDEPRLRSLVDWHVDQGTDVILANGTTGESATLSHEEQRRVAEIVVEQTDGRKKVMCGAGSNSTAHAVELCREAEAARADAILSVGPYYNKPTQQGYYEHFKAVCESTALPVFIYNVPGRTASNISTDTTLRLAELSNMAGVKEASANFSQIMEILRDRPDHFLVLSGDDFLAFPILALGGDGVISVAANQAPAAMSEMVHAALSGNWDRARELHFQLLPLMEINFIESNPIPVKAAMAMMGLLDEHYRLPMVPIGDSNRLQLRKVLQDLSMI